MKTSVTPNPFLSGNFAPIRQEDDFADLPVISGEVPDGLEGTFYRNGPNPQFDPRDEHHHWFAGDGMIHAFTLADGRISYRNRYVRTPKWQLEHEAGRALFGTFGNPLTTDPAALGQDSGLANTHIVHHAGRLLALEEGHQPFEVDARTLAPCGYLDYAGAARRFTAHPKIDPSTGEMVFFGYMAGDEPFSRQIALGSVDACGTVRRLDTFEAPYVSMIHDFFVTEHYVAIPVLPLTGDLERAMNGGPPFAWEPDQGAYVGVVRRGADIATLKWLETDPCYVFHPMNMWDDGEHLHADVMQYESAPLFPNADGSPGRPSAARLARWTLDLSGGTRTIHREYLDDTPGEFPRFDERRAGRAYRYGYFAARSTDDAPGQFDSIAAFDHRRKQTSLYRFAAGDTPGEPVFVPRRATAAEGDGWLVTVVHRGAQDRSDFVVFEAGEVARGPIAVAALPRRVPFGFHGSWVAAI